MSTTQRTKHGLRISSVLVIAASTAAIQWVAAQEERLTVEVGQCIDVRAPEQRLACFDEQVAAARSRAAAPATAPAPAARAAPAPAAPATNPAPAPAEPARAASSGAPAAAEFGFPEPREEPEPVAPPEVRAKIAELRETVPNAYLITLDNGQVWRQTRPDPYVAPRVGYDVRINMSRFRSYRLTSPDMPGFVQVERVR